MGTGPGGGARTKVAVGDVEALIRSLPAVEGARIVLDEWGGVREIHVLAGSSRHPKSIVRDIESALQSRWGLGIDHRRISVAQLDAEPRRPIFVRLRLDQFSISTNPVHGRTEVTVSLSPETPRDVLGRPLPDPNLPTESWHGHAAGPATGPLGVRLGAEAALMALNQALQPQHSFSMAETVRVPLGDREVIVCLLHYHAPRRVAEAISGSAVVRTDPVEAAVRAVLNGTNRLYGLAMRRSRGRVEPPAPWSGDGEAQAEAASAREQEVETGPEA